MKKEIVISGLMTLLMLASSASAVQFNYNGTNPLLYISNFLNYFSVTSVADYTILQGQSQTVNYLCPSNINIGGTLYIVQSCSYSIGGTGTWTQDSPYNTHNAIAGGTLTGTITCTSGTCYISIYVTYTDTVPTSGVSGTPVYTQPSQPIIAPSQPVQNSPYISTSQTSFPFAALIGIGLLAIVIMALRRSRR